MQSAATALGLSMETLRELKVGACPAFRGSRVYERELLTALAAKRLHSAIGELLTAAGGLQRVALDFGDDLPNGARLRELAAVRLDALLGELLEASEYVE